MRTPRTIVTVLAACAALTTISGHFVFGEGGEKTLKEIETLRKETLDESLANLHDYPMYATGMAFNDGVLIEQLPLEPSMGRTELNGILANRRVLKVIDQLSRMPKQEATALVVKEIMSTMEAYKKLAPKRKEARTGKDASAAAPTAFGWKIENNPDGTPTFQGARNKLLALVFIAGNLRMYGARTAVRAVLDAALEERAYYSDLAKADLHTGSLSLAICSLYNRQALGTALLMLRGTGTPEELAVKCGTVLKARDLTMYDADQLDLWGDGDADYSKGRITVRYLGEVSDEVFDRIGKETARSFDGAPQEKETSAP
jgi:hypothetical protein